MYNFFPGSGSGLKLMHMLFSKAHYPHFCLKKIPDLYLLRIGASTVSTLYLFCDISYDVVP
jgi:hypothetical protein